MFKSFMNMMSIAMKRRKKSMKKSYNPESNTSRHGNADSDGEDSPDSHHDRRRRSSLDYTQNASHLLESRETGNTPDDLNRAIANLRIGETEHRVEYVAGAMDGIRYILDARR